jgi:hypothetical protein
MLMEPLPLPVIVNLDPNFFEGFVALRVQQFERAADFLDGPTIEIADLAAGDIEAATDANWLDASIEAADLHDATIGDDVVQIMLNGDALETDLNDQASQPPLDPGPGVNEDDVTGAATSLKGGGSLTGTLDALAETARSLRNRP